MIVAPDFPNHWKTRKLVDDLEGDEAAPVYLLRLWGHCELRKQWVFDNLPATALKTLCRFPGHANKLESSLASSGFIRRDDSQVLTVLNWEEYNAELIAEWRPKTNAERQAAFRARKKGGVTKSNESNGPRYARNAGPIYITNNSISSSQKKIPNLEEVKEYCAQRAREGKPRVDPEQFFDFYEANGWVQGARGKPVKDWRACVRTWEKSPLRHNDRNGHKPGLYDGIAEWLKEGQG
jgi:hypothetical protein